MADIYNPRMYSFFLIFSFVLSKLPLLSPPSGWVFLCGAGPLGGFALGAGFVRNKIAIICLRALSGIGTSPS